MKTEPKNETREENRRPLRVQHIEGGSGDRGLPCESPCAASREEFYAVLGQNNFDSILLDYTPPGYSGTANIGEP